MEKDTAPVDDVIRDKLIGFEIGWDYAKLGVSPRDFEKSEGTFKPVLDGYLQGVQQFPNQRAQYAPKDYRFVIKWLRLRMNAYRRNRIFSPTLTWEHIRDIDKEECPITRERFTYGSKMDTDWSIDRVNNNGAYAPGNIMSMSKRANRAKGTLGVMGCIVASNRAKGMEGGFYHDLNETQWMRLAYLMSVNSTENEYEYGYLPLAAIPPKNMPVMNPLHILQARASHEFMSAPNSEANKMWTKAFKVVDSHNLHKRVAIFIAAARGAYIHARKTQKNTLYALTDAWMTPLVSQYWLDIAEKIDFDQASKVLAECQRLSDGTLAFGDYFKVREAWGTDTQGYVSPEMQNAHAGAYGFAAR